MYCSSDGIAAATRDGEKGSTLGTIDFVYDNGGSVVIPVTQGAPKGTPETLANYQQFYFPSNLLLRFNNMPVTAQTAKDLPQINQEGLNCYRKIDSGSSQPRIDFTVKRAKGWTDKDVQVLGGSGKSDFVKKEQR